MDNKPPAEKKKTSAVGIGIVFGFILGMLVGLVIFDNLVMGAAISMALGIVAGAMADLQRKKSEQSE